MSLPGWYPDPAGAPGRFRYWDGAAWSQETTSDPAQGAPTGSAPAPDAPQPERRRGLGWLALLAALVVLALVLWALFRPSSGSSALEDHNSSSPSGPVWNEKESASPSTDPSSGGGKTVACPTGGGNVTASSGSTLTSGGMSVDRIQGWDYPPSFELQSVHDVQVQLDLAAQGPSGMSWLSGQMVGTLNEADGFTSAKGGADQLMSCYASSDYYEGFTGRQDITSEAVTISGHQGWHLRSDLRVNNPSLPGIPGDRVDIYVVESGHAGVLAAYAGWATIGDTARQDKIDQAQKTLRIG